MLILFNSFAAGRTGNQGGHEQGVQELQAVVQVPRSEEEPDVSSCSASLTVSEPWQLSLRDRSTCVDLRRMSSTEALVSFPALCTSLIALKPFHRRYSLPNAPEDIPQRQLLYTALFLLIWGEAGNLRFMPECLAYIFHNVSIPPSPALLLHRSAEHLQLLRCFRRAQRLSSWLHATSFSSLFANS